MARNKIYRGQGETVKSIQRLTNISTTPYTLPQAVDMYKTLVLNYYYGSKSNGEGSAWELTDNGTTLTKRTGRNFTGEIVEFW